MRIFAAEYSNTFFPVYFQRYARCSARISFLSPCFRKEIPMCLMKLEYLVNGKVTAYLKASKYSARRRDRFCRTCAEELFLSPFSRFSHTYAISRIIIRSSRLSMLLSRVAFYSSCTLRISTCITQYSIPLNYSCSHFLASHSIIYFFDSSIIHAPVHRA